MTGLRRPSVRLLIVVVLLCVVAAGIGFLASRMVKSPAQVLAEAAPPPMTDITAEVEERQLSSTLAMEGVVGPQALVSIAAGGLGQGDGVKVVTSMEVAVGEEVAAGDVLAAVNGRPVIVLPGVVPAYRAMSLNTSGPDVAQLQSSLRSLGYSVRPDKDGVFGAGTSSAVRRLYRDRDLSPVPGPALPPPADPAAPAPDPGFAVPFGEVAFIASMPARVSSVEAPTGSVVTGSLLQLATGELVLSGTLDAAQSIAPSVGARVMLLMANGDRLPGSVVSVNAASPSSGDAASEGQGLFGAPQSEGEQITIVVKPDAALPVASLGQRARMMVDLAVAPAPGLVVPVAALTSRADGESSVTVVRADGAKEAVVVAAGFSGDGYVAVVPQTAGALAIGDRVLVGKTGGSSQ